MPFLEIKNLNVTIEGKEILKNVNLDFDKGKVYAIMGPNGSGKSTLAHVLMGNKKYNASGKIFFENEDITELSVNERAKKGFFLSFQYPSEISGITVSNFLRAAYSSVKNEKPPLFKFINSLKKIARSLGMEESFLSRYLNENFSGGEKKKTEIIQMLVLDPKLAILDETDSGLDIDSLKMVSEGIKKFINKNKTVIIITHHRKMLDYIRPDKLIILSKGKIIKEGEAELIDEIEKHGYSNIK